MTYSHILKSWSGFFGSLTKALEVLAVWEGIKPVARLLVYDADFPKTEAFLKSIPLHVEEADVKVSLSFSGGYSTKGLLVPKDDGEGWRIIYVSRDGASAGAAKRAEATHNHVLLGKLLGYPACCSRFFHEYSEIEKARNNTFLEPMLEHSSELHLQEAYPLENNVFFRESDACLLSHIPCSLDCERSKETGRAMMGLLHKYSSSVQQAFEKQLKAALLVKDGSVIILENASRDKKDIVSFSGAVSSPAPSRAASGLLDDLNRTKRLEVIGKKGVIVGERLYPEYSYVRFA